MISNDPIYYPQFNRNKRTLVFSTTVPENTLTASSTTSNTLEPYLNPTPLNKLLFTKLSKKCPKTVKLSVTLLEQSKYRPNTDLDIEWQNDEEICDSSTMHWLGLDVLFQSLKPATKLGKTQLKRQCENPTTDLLEIERRQELIQFMLQSGEGFVRSVRGFLKKTELPIEPHKFKELIESAIVSSKVLRFLKTEFNGHLMHLQLLREEESNQELFEYLSKNIYFDKVELDGFIGYWFKNDEGVVERWETIQKHLRMLHHDIKRKLSPAVEIDSKHKCFVCAKSQNLEAIPNNYIKKYSKTLKYFSIPELNELFDSLEILEQHANEHSLSMRAKCPNIKTTQARDVLARLDIASTFATLILETDQSNWSKPKNSKNSFDLNQAWHPNVPNSVKNDFSKNNSTILINGFNSSGKSTFLRTVGVCAYFNQIGMFVPCASCSIRIFDKIVSRAGADDDLSTGLSTFAAQMVEMSYILRTDTMEGHLVLLDELGSNTNETEGKAITVAVLNRLKYAGATTILATHFNVEEFESVIQDLQSLSLTQDHQLVHYDKKFKSNGWSFCKKRGFVE